MLHVLSGKPAEREAAPVKLGGKLGAGWELGSALFEVRIGNTARCSPRSSARLGSKIGSASRLGARLMTRLETWFRASVRLGARCLARNSAPSARLDSARFGSGSVQLTERIWLGLARCLARLSSGLGLRLGTRLGFFRTRISISARESARCRLDSRASPRLN